MGTSCREPLAVWAPNPMQRAVQHLSKLDIMVISFSRIDPQDRVISSLVLLRSAKHELSLASSLKTDQGECMNKRFAAARFSHLGGDLC